MVYNKHTQWHKYYNLLIFDEIDSTNDEAKRLIKAGVDGDFVIWAKSQTNGRGRFGRQWQSPKDNLYLTLLLRLDCKASQASQLSFVTAVALGDSIKELVGKDSMNDRIGITYKWPNDIFMNGKKLGGILIESSIKAQSEDIEGIIIGIGVNICTSPGTTAGNYQATNLHAEGHTSLTPDMLLDSIMRNFLPRLEQWQKSGFEPARRSWLMQSLELGKVVTISVGKDRVSGIFEDLTAEGCIKLVLANGHECYVLSGEVLYDPEEYHYKFA